VPHLAKKLIGNKRNHIWLVVRRTPEVKLSKSIRMLSADSADYPAMMSVFRMVDPNVVVYGASLSQRWNSGSGAIYQKCRSGILGLTSVLSQVENMPAICKFVLLSGDGVYSRHGGRPINEKTHYGKPEDFNILNDIFCEMACRQLLSDRKLNIIRCAKIYGPRRSVIPEMPVSWLIDAALSGAHVEIHDVDALHNHIHVDDAAGVIAKIVESETKHVVYNVGSDEYYTYWDIWSMVWKSLGKKAPPIGQLNNPHPHVRWDTSHIKKEFSFKAKHKLCEELPKLITFRKKIRKEDSKRMNFFMEGKDVAV